MNVPTSWSSNYPNGALTQSVSPRLGGAAASQRSAQAELWKGGQWAGGERWGGQWLELGRGKLKGFE